MNMFLFILAAHLCTALAISDSPTDLIHKAFAIHTRDGNSLAATDRLGNATITIDVHGSGFHRTVDYSVRFGCPSDEPPSALSHECKVAILQPLPAALYANIYELENAASVGQGPEVRLLGDIDVESIEKFASPAVLAVYTKVVACTAKATIMLHGRYPKPSLPSNMRTWRDVLFSPRATINQEWPSILLTCGEKDEWQRVVTEQPTRKVIWVLPAGNLAHAVVATVMTVGVVAVAAGVVLHAAFTEARPASNNKSRGKRWQRDGTRQTNRKTKTEPTSQNVNSSTLGDNMIITRPRRSVRLQVNRDT